MIGLFVLICVYVMLGFLFAWVAGIVAKEEVEISTGVLVLIVSAIMAFAAKVGLQQFMSKESIVWLVPVVNLAVLTVMTNLFAKLSWKHSAIIAVVYTVVIFLLSFALVSCMA